MGWIILLASVVLLIVLTRRTIDRETTRNLKYLGKIVAVVVGLIVLGVLFLIANH
jgi:multisubunit Na+/H+ antiporter MnhB subunit